MKILGIDPGYERMGVAIIERDTSKKERDFSDLVLAVAIL